MTGIQIYLTKSNIKERNKQTNKETKPVGKSNDDRKNKIKITLTVFALVGATTN